MFFISIIQSTIVFIQYYVGINDNTIYYYHYVYLLNIYFLPHDKIDFNLLFLFKNNR